MFESIAAKIKTTNNGKLMLVNLTKEERAMVPTLTQAGLLKRASFLQSGDSVRLA